MFSLTYSGVNMTEFIVTRSTKAAMVEEGVKKESELKDSGNVLIFNTELRCRVEDTLEAFNVLNEYVKSKGDIFIEELFKQYSIIYDLLIAYMEANDRESDIIKEKFKIQLDNIIQCFDINDICNYVSNVNKVPIPINLEDKFDMQLEYDNKATRAQTYVKPDYKRLMGFLVVLKAIYGPLGQLIFGSDENVTKYPELQMLDILKETSLRYEEGFNKLRVYVDAIVERTFDKEKKQEEKILSLQLPRTVIPDFYLSKIMFTRMIIMDMKCDADRTNIVKYIFRDISSKIKNKGSQADAIMNKTISSSETDDEDKESVIESYRIASELTPGISVELNWATDTVDKIIKQLPLSIRANLKDKDIQEGIKLASKLTPSDISNTHINIIGFLFKTIIDPRGLKHLKAVNIFNFIAVGYAILKLYNIDQIAYLLVSKRMLVGDIESNMEITTSISNTKGKGYRTQELETLFPIKKIEKQKDNSIEPGDLVVLDWVSFMFLEINKYHWVSPGELNITKKDILVPTLRNILIDMLIEHESRIIEKGE